MENYFWSELEKEGEEFKRLGLKAYQFATNKAERGVMPAMATRTGLALHYSIFMWDIIGQKADAMTLLKKAITAADAKMNQLEDADAK